MRAPANAIPVPLALRWSDQDAPQSEGHRDGVGGRAHCSSLGEQVE